MTLFFILLCVGVGLGIREMYMFRMYRWLLKDYHDRLNEILQYRTQNGNKIDMEFNIKFEKHMKFYEFYSNEPYRFNETVKDHYEELIDQFPEVFKSEYRENRLDQLLEKIED